MEREGKLTMDNLYEERKKAMEARYKELYSSGLNSVDTLKKLAEESGLSMAHLYRVIEVKRCKFEVNKIGRLK